jgi:hypothetical protein
MPAPATPIIPADAMAKADEKAKTKDYYDNLTDEERAEEGLPPREPAKADTAPGKEAPPEEKPEEEEEEVEEEEEPTEEYDAATLQLFEEIAGLREDISGLTGKPKPKTEKQEDAQLRDALEHEDPVVRAQAERLKAAEDRVEQLEKAARQERINRQYDKDTADFDAVQSNYLVDGKPMTDKQVEAVENYMHKNKEVGSLIAVEDAAFIVFKSRLTLAPKSPPARGPGDSTNGKGSPVATIVDTGSAGGASAGPWKPRPTETVESAVQAAGKAFGWTR